MQSSAFKPEGGHMSIKFAKGITEKDASRLSKWSNERGRAFQEQWMGSDIAYPLDCRKLQSLANVYSIYDDDEFLGIIQQVRIDCNNIHLGRFILNPDRTGLGYGKKSLIAFVELCFREDNIRSVSLNVYDDNKTAKALYEKVGFEVDEVIREPRLKYSLKKYR